MAYDRTHEPDCTAAREAVSAEQDGEELSLRTRASVAGHLEDCQVCARFAEDIAELARRTRVGAADPVPDLTATITARVAEERASASTSPQVREGSALRPSSDGCPSPTRRVRTRDLRRLVALAGAAQFVLAVPLLLGLVGPDVHVGRDLGALQVALGVGLVCAAMQPRRASGLLPVLAVVAATTVVAGVLDVVTGVATIAAELTHLSELVGVVALWALARRTTTRVRPSTEPLPVGIA